MKKYSKVFVLICYNLYACITPYIFRLESTLWYNHSCAKSEPCGAWSLIVLFVWGLSPHSKSLYSYGDVTIALKGCKFFTYARHSMPLSSEDSLACHTYCDTWHPSIMVISEDLWCPHLVAVELSLPVLRLRSVGWDSNAQPSACGANARTHCVTAAVSLVICVLWLQIA